MKGDIIIIEEEQRKKAQRAFEKIMELVRSNDKLIVTIGGVSGTNKSEVAYLIQEELYARSISSMALSLDDFYKTNWRDRNRVRRKKGIDSVGIKEIEWSAIEAIAKKFKRGTKLIKTREINKYSDQFEHYYIKRADLVRVLIIEGLYSCYLKQLGCVDFCVYLDGSIDDTYRFRKKRSKENPDSTFRQGVVKREAEDVLKTKEHADLIIPFNVR